jgi:DNA-binding NtrC family response regulator
MTTPWEVVVVSSDLESRRNLSAILVRQGIDPICASTLHECREILSQKNVGVVFCDSHVSDGTYKEFLGGYRSREERPRVIVTSRHSEWDEFKEAIRFGAFDVIGTPCRPTDVEWMIIQARRDDRKRIEHPSVAHVVPAAFAKAAAAPVS